jgi:predicted AAA+ superfamily ATPase
MASHERPSTLLDGLLLYRDIARDPVAQAVERLAHEGGDAGLPELYAVAFGSLAAVTGNFEDPWRHLVRRCVLEHDTPFSRAARAGGDDPPDGLAHAMCHDLRVLEELHAIDAEAIAERVGRAGGRAVPAWSELGTQDPPQAGIEGLLAHRRGWDRLIPQLWSHFRRHSAGIIGAHRCFRWEAGGLRPVEHPDPVTLDDLPGFDTERKALVDNTAAFAMGATANNALLFGPRGCGKSSTVKALANEFAERGVKLVQLGRDDIAEWPAILSTLRGRPERFIVFIDDLSFEAGELEYAQAKALLEGGLEDRPGNVVIYATSNRRNLVDEEPADRDPVSLHARDLFEHKLSLVDRFGLRVQFLPIDRATFLLIASHLATKAGLEIAQDALSENAERWAREHSGYSPRAARQFVDWLVGVKHMQGRTR